MAKIIVVGAGMCGVSAARFLTDQGHETLLIDKSRGVGGRMSTRRMAEARADHGAQYFSARTTEFQEVVKSLLDAKIVKEWRRFASDSHPRYVSISGMSGVPKFLAEGLNVLKSQRIVKVTKTENTFIVKSETGDEFRGDHLIVTIPSPQAIELIQNSKIGADVVKDLKSIQYDPCFALMLQTKSPVTLSENKLMEGPFAWQMDNKEKGFTEAHSYTLHTTHEFSIENLEDDVASTKEYLLANLPKSFKGIEIVESQIHRWRYSIAQERLDAPFLTSAEGIYFGGDGFGIGNVEGAFLSGLAIANDLIGKK